MRVRVSVIALPVLIVLTLTALAQRTPIKPATDRNPQGDIQLGLEVAKEAEKELVLITNRDANTYITNLGQRLLAKAPNPNKYPFTFKIVDNKEINAFALPGGPIYMHRGVLEVADNEAQVAGVMGHEIAHVLLRHGASQSQKAQVVGGLTNILGNVLGGSKVGQVAVGIGAFGANMKLLRYSRDAESQSDLMGTQMLYDSGYNPKAMAEFFEKLANEHKGSRTEQLFSNHPIPVNRVAKVNDEIRRIGPPLSNPKSDSPEFQRIKKLLLAMPAPKATVAANGQQPAQPVPAKSTPPPAPSARMIDLRLGNLALQHPDNWKPMIDGSSITLAPAGGISQKGDLAYGMIVDVFMPQNARSLDQATDQFLAGLQKGNPAMKVVRSRVQTRVDNWPGQWTELSNDSPIGGKETDIVITLLRSNTELQYFVLVAPTKDMAQYERTFQSILNSVQLR